MALSGRDFSFLAPRKWTFRKKLDINHNMPLEIAELEKVADRNH